MPSDYKENSIKRRDYRHVHTGPEIAPIKSAPKKKLWKVYCKINCKINTMFTEEFCFGTYSTKKQAEQAVTAKSRDMFYKDFRIEKVKKL